MDVTCIDGQVICTIEKQLVDNEAILLAANCCTTDFHVSIVPYTNDSVRIILEEKNKTIPADNTKTKLIYQNLINDIIDAQHRISLEKRFGHIRELIVEAAFSHLAKHT